MPNFTSQILHQLSILHSPRSVPQLQKTISANKTTIYRDLDKLVASGLVSTFDFGDGTKRYELTAKGHHHHLVCTSCGQVECYEVEQDIAAEEQRIKKTKQFTVTAHALEFFGLCANCQ